MLTDDRLGFDNRQSTQNARRDGIEAGEDQTVQIAERAPFWCSASKHVHLMAQNQDLRLERRSRSDQPNEAPA